MRKDHHLVVGLCIALLGCNQGTGPESNGAGQAEAVELPRLAVENAFPTAVTARLFVRSNNDKPHDQPFRNPDGVLLSGKQLMQLRSSMHYEPIKDSAEAACFVPHHLFRFFDAGGAQVGEMDICFCCFGVSVEGTSNISAPDRYYFDVDYERIARIVREVGEQVEANCDEDEAASLGNLGLHPQAS